MSNVRTYGHAPFAIAVVHGGPGAGGEMAPVARELAAERGVLEPLQTATSVEGQIGELRDVLRAHGHPPLTLIGFSWGAWLSYMLAARHPPLVKKLILVGCGPFEEKYVARLRETRLSRLGEGERAEWEAAIETLSDPGAADKDAALARLGALAAKTDAYDPVPYESTALAAPDDRGELYQNVWREAAGMRKSGALLDLANHIACPVVAIHGDYDPHPAKGVRVPLSARLARFRLVLLEHCGHTPWIERQARDGFYRRLAKELL